MVMDKKSNLSLYKKLELILRDQILFGELSPGVLLPTEQELCEQYKMSRITVRNALANLERSGLINRIQGRGSIVRKREVQSSFVEAKGFTSISKEQGYNTSSEIVKKELIAGNTDLIALFGGSARENELFWHFCGLRYLNDEPAVIMNHYVKKALGDKMLEFDLEKNSLYYLYEHVTHLKVIRIKDGGVMYPVQATPEIAKILKVKSGTELMWFRGITYLEGNIPVEVSYSLFVASKFIFIGSIMPRKVESVGLTQKGEGIDFEV